MGYIGSKPATNFETVRKQVSTTNSGTTITLDYSVSSVQDILVTVNAVVQSYDNYTVSGTTLTLGGTLNNDRVEILYVGRTFQTVTPAVGTVTNDMLSGSIANSKLANSSITLNGSAVSLGGSASVGKALGITTRTVISQNLTSSTSFSQISDWNTSYTIQEVGSKIHIRLCGSVRNDGGGSGSRRQSIKINYHQNGGSDTTLINRDLGNGQGENGFVNLEGVFTATSTGACSISVYHKTNTSGDTVRLISEFGISGQTGFLTVTEYGT